MSFPIEFVWHPNPSDAKLGVALGTYGTRGRVLRTVFIAFVVPALAVWALLGSPLQATLIAAIWAGLFLSMFPTLLARKVAQRQAAQASSVEVRVSGDAVESKAGGTLVRQEWSDVTHVLELPTAFLLLARKVPVASIEKSSMNSSQLEALRSAVASLKPLYARKSVFLALERRPGEA